MSPAVLRGERLLVASPQQLGPDGDLAPGWVIAGRGTIEDAGRGAPPGTPDLEAAVLAPAFVDVHCHGGGGCSVATTDPDEARAAASFHRAHGTGTQIASLVTAAIDDLEAQLHTLAPLCADGVFGGIHLEGPWLSIHQRGAHDAGWLRPPEPDDIDRLVAAGDGHLRMVTIAPELPGALTAIGQLRDAGVVVALGHTDADEAQFRAGVAAGARVVTHLCNAMRPIHHRDPGPVVAALSDERLAVELIVDGIHLHPEVVDLLQRSARSQILLITDAMSAAGCGDGRYQLGRLAVDVIDGVAQLADGSSIAGSTLTMDRAVRTAHASGMPAAHALDAATRRPADALGLRGGRLTSGTTTPVLLFDDRLALQTIVETD